jgi:hypothetical protein
MVTEERRFGDGSGECRADRRIRMSPVLAVRIWEPVAQTPMVATTASPPANFCSSIRVFCSDPFVSQFS